MTKIKGFIFDMDGTLIDNMMVHHRAWQQKLRAYGVDWSLKEVMEKVHGVNVELLERLFGDRFTPEERIRISAEKEEAYRAIYQEEIKPIEGLLDFLETAKAANIPMAIATAAPPENAYFVLENLPIKPYFKALFHSDDVSRGKPDPQVFELAADALRLPLQNCLIFEDSLTGAEAAKRAGCPAIIL
ncbi:MAG: HAD family phosphatase, partial [Bacteroidota bacterium]